MKLRGDTSAQRIVMSGRARAKPDRAKEAQPFTHPDGEVALVPMGIPPARGVPDEDHGCHEVQWPRACVRELEQMESDVVHVELENEREERGAPQGRRRAHVPPRIAATRDPQHGGDEAESRAAEAREIQRSGGHLLPW